MKNRHTHWRAMLGAIISGVTLLAGFFSPLSSQKLAPLLVYDFDLGPSPASNVDRVRALGFDGLVTRCSVVSDVPKLASYAAHVANIDDFRMLAYVNYDFNNGDSPQVWRDALPILATLEAPLWVIVKNIPTLAEVDALLLDMAQTSAAHGVPMVLYPHWNTNIENADGAAARIAQVGHPNIKNSLHSCHEIRSGNQYSLASVVGNHAQETSLVTIAGADTNAYAGLPPHDWDDAIRPLDLGGFDLTPFLRALKQGGYKGPVILHTWGLADEPGHLPRSLARYVDYRRHL